MPKTVTLSDEDLAVLRAARQIVADVQHPARPAAVAVFDRIAAAPVDIVVTRTGAQPLDVSDPDGHRYSQLDWDSRWNPMGHIVIVPGQDLHLAVMRPNDDLAVQRWPLGIADNHRRALYHLSCAVYTRPMR